jgi:hypothetical protein
MNKNLKMVIVAVAVIATISFAFFAGGKFKKPVKEIVLQCNPLQQGSFLEKIKKDKYDIEGTNQEIIVLEGFKQGLPSESVTDSADLVPRCYTNLEGYKVYKNLNLIDQSGNRVQSVKVIGSIVGEGSNNSPLP